MEILCTIFVIYVTADILICAYVVRNRGGIKATIADVRENLAFTRDTGRDDDVYDRH